MNKTSLLRAATMLLSWLLLLPISGTAQADAEFQSYLAHIAAASSALRLHETAEAKRWLAAAPAKHRNWEWHYLNAQAEQSSAVLTGHTDAVTAVAFSPDGKRLVSASSDRTPQRGVFGIVEIWNAETGELVKSFEYGTHPLVSLAFSPDGNKLAVGGWEPEHNITIWETDKWATPVIFTVPPGKGYKVVQSIVFSADGRKLIAGYKDSMARVWDVESKKLVQTLGGRGWGHGKWVNGVAFHPHGKLVATASPDQTVKLWDVATGANVLTFAYDVQADGAFFSPDGQRLITLPMDKTARRLNVSPSTR